MKLGLVYNEKSKISLDEIKYFTQFLNSLGHEIFMHQNLQLHNVYFLKNLDELMKITEIILVFGGDGTAIKFAKIASFYKKPILGINSGHLGFLSCFEKNEFKKIEKVLNGKCKISERIMLECECNGKKFLALNDIVLNKGLTSRAANYSILKENNLLFKYLADGIIFSTPTGSTAYSLSAGGPILEPCIESVAITPICAHTIGSKSLVADISKPFFVKYNLKQASEVCLFIDGKICFSNNKNGFVKIKRSNLKASFLQLPKQNFFYSIEKKLMYKN